MNKPLLVLLPLMLLMAACNAPEPAADTGQARVLMTDAPVAEAQSLPVTIVGVELVGEAEGTTAVSTETQTIDVLTLRNGALVELGIAELPAGTYHQVRLIVDAAAIVFSPEESYEVEVPSGAQSGLKINVEPPLVVAAGQTSELLLDFDVQRAVVETPAGSGNYLLKPTSIRAAPVVSVGTVQGSVVAVPLGESGLALPVSGVGVTVLDQEGLVVTSTITEADGSFKIISLPTGTYDLEFDLVGYSLLTVEDVVVVAGEVQLVAEVTLEAEVAP